MSIYDDMRRRQKEFDRTEKLFYGWFCFIAFVGMGMMAFAGWVVIKLLQHYGVV